MTNISGERFSTDEIQGKSIYNMINLIIIVVIGIISIIHWIRFHG
jgi:hypothetical protein